MPHGRREYVLNRDLQPQEEMLLRIFDRSESLVVFDVGACEGENAVRYGHLFPRARVYAVEPLPENIALMNRAVAEHSADNVTPIEACLADREAEADFHVSSGTPPRYSEQDLDWDFGNKSSSLLVPGEANAVHPWLQFTDTIKVATSRLDRLAAHLHITHIDFLHLDVQGAELMVLRGAGALLERTWTIWLEVEAVPLYVGQPVGAEVESFLRRHGFVKLLDTVGDVSGDQFWSRGSWLQVRKGAAWMGLARLKYSLAAAWARLRVRRVLRVARGR